MAKLDLQSVRSREARPASQTDDPGVTVLLESIERCGVRIEGRAEVRDYLAQHPGMGPLVLRVCALAREKLSPATELTLEVYHDPEIYDPHLVMYARQDVYDDAFMEQLEEIGDLYAEDLVSAPEWFILTTDFERPGVPHGV